MVLSHTQVQRHERRRCRRCAPQDDRESAPDATLKVPASRSYMPRSWTNCNSLRHCAQMSGSRRRRRTPHVRPRRCCRRAGVPRGLVPFVLVGHDLGPLHAETVMISRIPYRCFRTPRWSSWLCWRACSSTWAWWALPRIIPGQCGCHRHCPALTVIVTLPMSRFTHWYIGYRICGVAAVHVDRFVPSKTIRRIFWGVPSGLVHIVCYPDRVLRPQEGQGGRPDPGDPIPSNWIYVMVAWFD